MYLTKFRNLLPPWSFRREKTGTISQTEGWPNTFAIISRSEHNNPKGVEDRFVGFALRKEDARVMAAAPDLLQALDKLFCGYGSGNSGECWDDAREAYKKATGKDAKHLNGQMYREDI